MFIFTPYKEEIILIYIFICVHCFVPGNGSETWLIDSNLLLPHNYTPSTAKIWRDSNHFSSKDNLVKNKQTNKNNSSGNKLQKLRQAYTGK